MASVGSAVIVAPLFEEFLFRGLLQGWLEKMVSRVGQPLSLIMGGARGCHWAAGKLVESLVWQLTRRESRTLLALIIPTVRLPHLIWTPHAAVRTGLFKKGMRKKGTPQKGSRDSCRFWPVHRCLPHCITPTVRIGSPCSSWPWDSATFTARRTACFLVSPSTSCSIVAVWVVF